MLAPKNNLLALLALLLIQFFRPVLAVRADACGKYACGFATWTWDTESSIRDISLSIKDNKCDAHYAYIYLRYEYSNFLGTHSKKVLRFENHAGCKADYAVNNTPFLDVRRDIKRIAVYVCRSEFFDDSCYSSGYLNNEYV